MKWQLMFTCEKPLCAHAHVLWHKSDFYIYTQQPLSVSFHSTHMHVKYAAQHALRTLRVSRLHLSEGKEAEIFRRWSTAVNCSLSGVNHIRHNLKTKGILHIQILDDRHILYNNCFEVNLYFCWWPPCCNILKGHLAPRGPLPPLGVSAPLPADLFQNVSFSPRLCCLFYRSLSLCCERLRLLVMEVNLTNLWISLSLSPLNLFLPLFSHFVPIISIYNLIVSSSLPVLAPFSPVIDLYLLIKKSSVNENVNQQPETLALLYVSLLSV